MSPATSGGDSTSWAGVGELEQVASLLGYEMQVSNAKPTPQRFMYWVELQPVEGISSPSFTGEAESPLLALLDALSQVLDLKRTQVTCSGVDK